MQSYGFKVPIAYADSDTALATLNGLYAGTVIDRGTSGAHNDRADVAIRLIKEIARSMYAHVQQQYPVPPQCVGPLLRNAAYQLNTFRGRSNRACPRIEATGIKPIYSKEFGLAFGDYAEVRDHTVAKNNVAHGRTLGCIALYPSGNSQGSWVFWHLTTNKTLTSSDWIYLLTPEAVILQLKQMSSIQLCENVESKKKEIVVPEQVMVPIPPPPAGPSLTPQSESLRKSSRKTRVPDRLLLPAIQPALTQ